MSCKSRVVTTDSRRAVSARRSSIAAAGLAVAAALSVPGCSAGGDQSPAAGPAGPSKPSAPAAATAATTAPTTTTSAPRPAPAGMSGLGCTGYQDKVPAGPGSLEGMSRDPLTVALANSPMLTTFAGALSGRLNSEVDLVETLNKDQYTVFAPTDDAFGRVDPATVDKFKTDSKLLTSVLGYHIVSGQTDPESLAGEHKSLQGDTLNVSGSGEDLKVNGAAVACGPIRTTNATVYLIDTVLMPPTPAAATTSGSPTSTTTTP